MAKNNIKTIGQRLHEIRASRETVAGAAREASMTPEQRKAREDYVDKLRANPHVSALDTFAEAARLFRRLTGKDVRKMSPTTLDNFRKLHGYLSAYHPQGLLLVGGTGCGKTTMANTFSALGNYRVVNCVVVAREYEKEKGSLDKYLNDSVCFDDMGAEQRAYGRDVMSDIVQLRYERWHSAQARLRDIRERGASLHAKLRNAGWEESDYYGERLLKVKEADPLQWVNLIAMFDRLRHLTETASELEGVFPRTHFTSNMDFTGIEERYGDRVASRLREMCKVVSFADEPDHRREQ